MDVLDIFLLYWDRLFYTCFLLQGVSPGMVDWTSKTRLRWVRKLPIEPIAFELSTFQVDEFLDFWQSTLNPAALALVQNVLMYKLFFRYFSAILLYQTSIYKIDIDLKFFTGTRSQTPRWEKIVFLTSFHYANVSPGNWRCLQNCLFIGTHFESCSFETTFVQPGNRRCL